MSCGGTWQSWRDALVAYSCIKSTGLLCYWNRSKSSEVKWKQLPLETLTLSVLIACNFLHFCSPHVCPQDLGPGWLWDAALCFMLFLCSQQLSVNWWVAASQMLQGGLVTLSLQVHRWISLDARAKMGSGRSFYVFPCIYVNIHWKETWEILHFMFSFYLWTVLHSTNLVFGLAQNFAVVYPRDGYTWWWERVYLCLNYKNAELFSGYKIGSATGRQWGLLSENYTAEERQDGFFVLILSPSGTTFTCGAEGCRKLCSLGMPRAPINIRLCYILTRRLISGSNFSTFPSEKMCISLQNDNMSFCLQISYNKSPV